LAASTATPGVRLYFGDRGRIRGHFGPNPANKNGNGLPTGVHGVIIAFAGTTAGVGTAGGAPTGAEAWLRLPKRSGSPFVHEVETAAPRTFAYRCRYVNRKGELGPWSAPVVGTVTP
jgi:hypothetical protein